MAKEHYLKVSFPLLGDNSPGIYNFLFECVADVLQGIGARKVELHIERLEPLDEIYTNIYGVSRGKIRQIFKRFTSSHHLIEAPDLTATHERASLRAKINTANLQEIFRDYNALFDIFFTDLQIKSDGIALDVMDPFSNSLIAISADRKVLESFRKIAQKRCKMAMKFSYIDSRPGRVKLTHIRKRGAKH
ncbi:MAG: hypothetical protein J4415_00830 [Candidatus Diapherotrites archaeon]|uniref:Uncharacterized protein n=1 Tax=Candidatus Iainarchaeum sp. TaxID=3101447 RepID=A0A8T4KQ58_9ARCH|nr:hypothetical protein [Candidatus Diapherotrites archaeon]